MGVGIDAVLGWSRKVGEGMRANQSVTGMALDFVGRLTKLAGEAANGTLAKKGN